MTVLAALALAAGVGLASALVPLVNAEAYAVLAAARAPSLVVVLVLALAAGQTAGKLVLFESARRGASRFAGRHPGRSRWASRVAGWLRADRTGVPLVLAAASLGVPPLAVVSLAAGAAGQRRWLFGGLCLAGRTVRFAVLVAPAASLL